MLPLPRWAHGAVSSATQDAWDLAIGHTPITLGDRRATAMGINGTVPGPLLRLREGQRVALNVTNNLAEDSSIHWHGLLLPTDMDGVPGMSFDGIKPGGTYHYEFDVRQNGTYWYHSHSGLQEQLGVYGPMIIDPAGDDPVEYDREFVIMLSDWTFDDPYKVYANLKRMDDYYNFNRKTGLESFDEWSGMRMAQSDIADVNGSIYTFLMNGRDSGGNWTGIFEPGERVRLRVINGSAMSFFNVRIPGVPMTVVQADGQNVEPVEVDEFQVGVAETYDVIVTPGEGAHTIMAEAMDRSGYVSGRLTSDESLYADAPPLREAPLLTMADMGMDHGSMSGHGGHHGHSMPPTEHDHKRGPGVANVTEMAMSRLDHPGIGLDNIPHRVLRYSQLRSLAPNKDTRKPARTIEIHLTGNMHRYMWSFDGIKFSEVKEPIQFEYGERLRITYVNDTMMAHPMHLHGMFVELVNGNGVHNPRKHTVTVKPAEKLSIDITADEPGLWAFHCHLLMHMKAGMMRAVRVSDAEARS